MNVSVGQKWEKPNGVILSKNVEFKNYTYGLMISQWIYIYIKSSNFIYTIHL